jgi:glutamate-1-semialdehyde 2,1-aminomutase
MTYSHSHALFALAQRRMPGGVSSPVRAFRGVDSEPVFMHRGHGAYLVDVQDNEYIDYVGSWGPLIVGHAHPYVMERVMHAIQQGFSFGTPTEVEIQLAEKVYQCMPTVEMIRFVNSGTEAAMSAIRLARGYTKRNKIIKFIGGYHGHVDSLLVAAGSGGLTLGLPNSAGVPTSVVQHTLLAPYNDLERVSTFFAQQGDDIAGVIVEPIAGNMNCVLPVPGFLEGLRQLCNDHGSILIFDEVMTGFRVALGGAQAYYNIVPDITVLGKIIGGGFPVGAFGGRADIMRLLAPLGPVYQAGTLSGNPVAMTAGLAQLTLVSAPHFYSQLSTRTRQLTDGLMACAQRANIPFYAHAIGGMFGMFFTDRQAIYSEDDVTSCRLSLFKRFFCDMLRAGIYFAPSAFEAGFVSAAHEGNEIKQTLVAAEKVFADLCEYVQ